jgi:hypothetical protein
MKRSDFVIPLALAALAAMPRAVAAADDPARPVSRDVVKLIIGDLALAAYLHPERPGRLPLLISDHLVTDGVTPSFSSQPVRFISDGELKSLPHLRFSSFELTGDQAQAAVDYEVERVRVLFTLRNQPGWWSVVKSQVVPLK